MNLLKKYFRTSVIAVILALTSLFAILLPIVTVNAVSAQIEIISIEETSGRSVEITFNSRIMKKQISYFTITASPDFSGITQPGNSSLQQNKQISKKLNRKATGLIIYEFKPIPTAVPYTFKVCAKSITGKTICSDSLKHPQFADLFEQISRLPSDWGNPKPIQLPVPAPAPAPAILSAPAFTLTSSTESRTVNTAATGFTINSTGGAIASFAINATPPGMSFNNTTGALTGTPNTVASATTYTITATNASGSTTQTFTLTVTAVVYTVGQRGPGGGIVYYVSATNFTSTGSTCNTACKYLEVAPSTWQSGGVSVGNDLTYVWSDNTTSTTVQDKTTPSTEGFIDLRIYEKLNWKIGQGFYNTSVMKVSGATSTAQAAVLAYAGGSTAGQWFIPSWNELNELCKYARGQTTGNPTVACVAGSGTFKSTANVGTDLGGFQPSFYWSSSEVTAGSAWRQMFDAGALGSLSKTSAAYVRPIRAFGP